MGREPAMKKKLLFHSDLTAPQNQTMKQVLHTHKVIAGVLLTTDSVTFQYTFMPLQGPYSIVPTYICN